MGVRNELPVASMKKLMYTNARIAHGASILHPTLRDYGGQIEQNGQYEITWVNRKQSDLQHQRF